MKIEFSFFFVIENYFFFLVIFQLRKVVVVFFVYLKIELMSFIKLVFFGFFSLRIIFCFIIDINFLLFSCLFVEKKYMNWKINQLLMIN